MVQKPFKCTSCWPKRRFFDACWYQIKKFKYKNVRALSDLVLKEQKHTKEKKNYIYIY